MSLTCEDGNSKLEVYSATYKIQFLKVVKSFSRLESHSLTLACEDTNSKLVDVETVADQISNILYSDKNTFIWLPQLVNSCWAAVQRQ